MSIRIDENSIKELAESVDGFEKLLQHRDRDYDDYRRTDTKIRELQKQVSEKDQQIRQLETFSTTVEGKATIERGQELDEQEKRLTDIKKLEYQKGYSAAVAEYFAKAGGVSK